MRRFQQIVLATLYLIGWWHLWLWLERFLGSRRNHVLALVYHHIVEVPVPDALSYLEEGVQLTDLKSQLKVISKWYRPLACSELCKLIRGETTLNGDGLIVTFDDGYLDNRHLAGPVLRKYGITGLVFLPTGYLNTNRRLWWVQLNDILKQMSVAHAERVGEVFIRHQSQAHQLILSMNWHNWSQRRQLRVALAKRLEASTDAERTEFLDELQSIVSPEKPTCLPLVTWEDVRAMRSEGFEFGAHTVTHPKMTQLSSEENVLEVRQSIDEIEKHTAHRPQAFAYPYGDFDTRVRSDVAQAEIELAFTMQPGVFIVGNTQPLSIPRIALYHSHPTRLLPLVFCLKMTKYFPTLFCRVLSRMFGSEFACQQA